MPLSWCFCFDFGFDMLLDICPKVISVYGVIFIVEFPPVSLNQPAKDHSSPCWISTQEAEAQLLFALAETWTLFDTFQLD